ncbi:hypothetical protein GCM10009746_14090 [Microbacterium paludicola]
MTGRPWWALRSDDDDVITHGEPGEGRVLVTIRRDGDGTPLERAWIRPDLAWQWEDTPRR